MATEWYLLNPPYSQTSGFEEDALDASLDAFDEALDSPIAVDVKYCNPDLSVCTDIKAIILRNVQDTKLNAFTRHLLTPIGTCKAGNYILYKGRYWIIVGLVDNNAMYEKAVMHLCNWKMTWINNTGDIIQRWAYIESASQYNNGERDIRNYTIRTDQLLVYLPYDDECFMLDTGVRFIIDKRTELYERNFDDSVTCDTSNDLITYELTRSDSVLFNYIDSGHYEILVTQDEKHKGDGYYLIDGVGYWLCANDENEIVDDEEDDTSQDETKVSTAEIQCKRNLVFVDLPPSTFTAVYYDENGDIIDTTPSWELNCTFDNKLNITYSGNIINISTDDYSLINKSFELFLSGYESDSKITIEITALI